MKAAVLHAFGERPRYEEFPDPVPGDGEVLVEVKAVALENFDRMLARGSHYASRQLIPEFPAILGTDGIGSLEDGTLVAFGGVRPPYGSMAERALIPKDSYFPVPDGIDAATAATIPGSAMTSLFSLRWGVGLEEGETVLVNGATGFAGKLAVQVARLLGAGRVVGTGRDDAALRSLRELGADAVIDLKQPPEQLAEAFTAAAGDGYDVILDYLWGRPTEILLRTLVPRKLALPTRRCRLVQIGEMAGPTISLSADALRTSGLVIQGAGTGIPPEVIGTGTEQVMEWIRAGKLHAGIEQVPLRDVERVWERSDLHGRRIVLVP